MISITEERPDTEAATALILELEAYLASLYPRESRHGYSVEKLIAQKVVFFLLRDDGTPAACGGVQLFGTEYGELKRMYVRSEFRGRGIGVLRLETGIHQTAAIWLYEQAGFQPVPPFGEYKPDPNSLFYEKRIRWA